MKWLACLAFLVVPLAQGFGQEPVSAPAEVVVSSAAGFRYESGRLPVGRVYRYRKSNLDGSNPSEIALYLASETRIEALKWHAGRPETTLVVAEMDWDVFSARAFKNYQIDALGTRTLVAELETAPDRKRVTVRVRGRELSCDVESFPWHSYDFDFASLNVALRYLADPEGAVEFGIVDPVHGPGGPRLGWKGRVTLGYLGAEERAGLECRRYELDGPGLEHRGGAVWVAKGEDVFLVAFEIDLPDEPGMSSGRLEWMESEDWGVEEWEEFVKGVGR